MGEGAPPWLGGGCAGAMGTPGHQEVARASRLSCRAALGGRGCELFPQRPPPGGTFPCWFTRGCVSACAACADALPVSGEDTPILTRFRGQASPRLSSLTLVMHFHLSEWCVEPQGLTCLLPHCTLCPCPSNVTCVGNAYDNLQLNTHTCTHRSSASPASPWLCSGGFLPQDRLPLATQGSQWVLTACADPSQGLRASLAAATCKHLSSPRAGLTTTCSDNLLLPLTNLFDFGC